MTERELAQERSPTPGHHPPRPGGDRWCRPDLPLPRHDRPPPGWIPYFGAPGPPCRHMYPLGGMVCPWQVLE